MYYHLALEQQQEKEFWQTYDVRQEYLQEVEPEDVSKYFEENNNYGKA